MEMKYLRRVKGVNRLQRHRNEDIRRALEIQPITEYIEKRQLEWWGHLMRLPNNTPTRKIWEARNYGKRKRGRPEETWDDTIKKNYGKEESNNKKGERNGKGQGENSPAVNTKGKTTILHSTRIGLMRGGYFLAEESPERLISQFNAESLEDVFLKLSVIQNMGKRRRSSILQSVTDTIHVPPRRPDVSVTGRVSIAPEPSVEIQPELPPDDEPEVSFKDYLKIVKMNHMRALIWKNFLWMWRNIPIMMFIIGLPVGQIILFCWSIGHDPLGLKLSVVNNEINYPKEKCVQTPGCNSTRLSCNYLDFIVQNYSVELEYYNTEDEARRRVEKGQTWGMLVVPHNFSDSLRSRLDNGKDVPEWDLVSSSIGVYQDKSNENIASYLQRDLLLPIKYMKPIYGYGEPDFTDFAAPGVILTIVFFMAVALTSGAMLIERNEGLLERSLVNGISGVELLFSQVITQFVVMLGFVVSCICDNERSATYLALGSFLPIVMLCGIIWPIEAMNDYLRLVS
ncbi:hypothetical protein NQ318_011524 [Aromia moschata]|uniref:ABC-2 type transporter transmembrane domain-containing protein n=1 Tax=Aromia moschata TaxID=1265417 RepID=A0AAV8XSH5_9CUCU|nr:hypothetical protein NQ318_011524 [Aromia moschata]